MEFKKLAELYKELNYTPPEGGMECMANIWVIFSQILSKCDYNIELDKKEFTGFMTTFGNEAMMSILLDKRFEDKGRAGINSILREGIEFRGIMVRVIK